jgi:hypothetical protein
MPLSMGSLENIYLLHHPPPLLSERNTNVSSVAMTENYTYSIIYRFFEPGKVLFPSSIVIPETKIL